MSTGWPAPVSLSGSTLAGTSESLPSRSRRTSTRTRSRRSSLPPAVVALAVASVTISGWCTMPNSKAIRRRFGSVRRLPSGRYQARYPGPDGMVRPADDTFETKTDAEVWLIRKEAEILEDDWIDPDAGEGLLPDYSATWIDERPGLRPKTVTLYRYLLRSHIAPHFPALKIGRLKVDRK